MSLTSIVMDLFEQYRTFSQVHPIGGAMATATVVFPLADVASQALKHKKVDWNKVRYTAELSPLYGIIAHGCVKSGNLVGEYISPHPLAKAALGPNLWGNVFNIFFFVNNTVGERTGYQLREWARHYYSLFHREKTEEGRQGFLADCRDRVKHQILDYVSWPEYTKAIIGTFTFWNAFQYANYSYTPEKMQTAATLGMTLFWTVLLSSWSLAGRKKGAAYN